MLSGGKVITNGFLVILPGNEQVPETNEIRRNLSWETVDLSTVQYSVYCYRGIVADGAFMDTNTDLSHLSNTSNVQTFASRSGHSGVYYEVCAEVVMLFGGTEIEARLCWKENGVEKRSNAEVLYTDDLPKEPRQRD